GPGQIHADVGHSPAGRRSVAAAGQCGAWPWPVRRVAVASTGGTIRVAAVTAGPGTGCPERAWGARGRGPATGKQAGSGQNGTPISRARRGFAVLAGDLAG